MRRETRLRVIFTLALLAGSCGDRQMPAQISSTSSSRDTVKIVSILPATGSSLRMGDRVPFKVEVAYTLVSADSGSVTLVIQQGESGHLPLANETQVVEKGSGTLVLTKEVVIPDTGAIQVFTPLTVQSGTSTNVVDTRAYKVAKD